MQLVCSVQERLVRHCKEDEWRGLRLLPRGKQLRAELVSAAPIVCCEDYPPVLCLEKAQHGCGTADYNSNAIAAEAAV